jgi:hypothetical protein
MSERERHVSRAFIEREVDASNVTADLLDRAGQVYRLSATCCCTKECEEAKSQCGFHRAHDCTLELMVSVLPRDRQEQSSLS